MKTWSYRETGGYSTGTYLRRERSLMKLSVIIPAYKRATFICPTSDLILNDGVDSLGLVVVDEGFADGAAEMIREYWFLSASQTTKKANP